MGALSHARYRTDQEQEMKVLTDKTPTKKECAFRGKYGTCDFTANLRWCPMNDGKECPFCIGFDDFLNRRARDLHDENSD